MSTRRSGFTLIELLVVIAIIAILAAILFPVFARAKETASRTKCATQMKQINIALINYCDDNGNKFPPVDNLGRINDIVWGGSGNGKYIQDFLDRYLKNRAVWMCPAMKPTMHLPKSDVGSAATETHTWAENTGGTIGRPPPGGDGSTATNYGFNWIAHGSGDFFFRVSGSSTAAIKRPTKAMTFIEMPYSQNSQPHGSNDGKGVNIAFYDSHVMYHKNNDPNHYVNTFYEWSTQGWK